MLNQIDRRGNKTCERRGGLVAACVCVTVLGPTTAVRGQCTPQEVAHLVASDGAPADQFGFKVAISGDTLIAGANFDDNQRGSAYIFVLNGNAWTQQAKLVASNGAAQDFFGMSVAIFGDTAVVGAPRHDIPNGADSGSAFVFVRSGTTWTQQDHLYAPDGAANDGFGAAVGIWGDTIVVGARRDDTVTGGIDAGSAHVFVRTGTSWAHQDHLFADDGAPGDLFSSFAVDIYQDTIVAGAEFDDTAGGVDAGSAYVFQRSGTEWTQSRHLFAYDGESEDLFGGGVAIYGDTVVVGAYWDNTEDGPFAGSAYVFDRSASWAVQKLTASDGAAEDQFGAGVAVWEDTIVVGGWLDDTEVGGVDAGSAYVFKRNENNLWVERDHVFATDGAPGDEMGLAVALSGDTAVIGAYLDDTPAGTDSGSIYVFNLACRPGDLDCNNLIDLADMPHFIEAMLSADFTGCDISRADVNQDGQTDGRDAQAFVAHLLAS